MSQTTFKYPNADITVVWKPGICIHSGICFRGLPEVFDPRRRPWIEMDRSDTERIIQQVKRCPSGALSYFLNGSQPEPEPPESSR
jgi:uncharacterized Fe-S cluster protein YjdI